jgi:hypothetical protein
MHSKPRIQMVSGWLYATTASSPDKEAPAGWISEPVRACWSAEYRSLVIEATQNHFSQSAIPGHY